MHIMFLYYSLSGGGAERVITSLANDFVSKGIDVTIVVLENKQQVYSLDKGVKVVCIKTQVNFGNRNKFSQLKFFRKEIKARKPDVIVAFSLELMAIAKLASLLTSVKIIGSERAATKWNTASKRQRLLMKSAALLCDGYVFLTQKGMEAYPKNIWRKAIIIPNAVYANVVPRLVPNLKDRKGNKVISVGRLSKGKDFATLVKAFSAFHIKFPQYTLDIYGVGPEEENLRDLANRLHIDKFVVFKGYVEDVPTEMCKYSMFVFTSKSEGMPNSLIEALACGLPCISTDCDFGPAELINEGINGLLVPVGDVVRITEAMMRIASDKTFAQQLSENALMIQQTYSSESICQRYNDYICKVMKIMTKD